MRAEGVSFRHAVELLRERYLPSLAAEEVRSRGGRPVARRVRPERSTVQKLDVPFDADASDEELLRDVVRYYHEALLESPEALEYLDKRGLRNDELIERFQLGFANRTLGLPSAAQEARRRREALRGRLQGLGVSAARAATST